MARQNNQKLKIYHLVKILTENTDETHYMSMPEILKALEDRGVTVTDGTRKSLYEDFEVINDNFGIEIVGERRGKGYGYHVVSKDYELAECKLLVDAIQSSKFITKRKSNELIHKIEKHVSKYEAKQLQRQVYVNGRIKTMNESIYYNVDAIHGAIADNKQIKFQYMQWDLNKELVPKKEGAYYYVSPWGLLWEDENYYLIAYDEGHEEIRHYRVDKMQKIALTEETRNGKEVFDSFNLATYAKQNFGMFSGQLENVRLRVSNKLIGVILDRFGTDVMIVPDGDDHFHINVEVAVSDQFYAWVFGLGRDVRIMAPQNVKDDMIWHLVDVRNMYND
ncbi:MAG: WYL domain-containing protein [Lachnospiraceae bacterium]|nr:WYL domain-containing protein [Lachnospiraceae bacterium]